MSPYPAKVTREGIIEQARHQIETEGVEALSLSKLASAMGIKAASLYNHFTNKNELLKSVNTLTVTELIQAMWAASNTASNNMENDPKYKMFAMVSAYRDYAHHHPMTYGLAFNSTIPDILPDAIQAEGLAIPIQTLMAQLTGEARALSALRGAMALVHGYVMLELSGQFRRGGDLDQAFRKAVMAYLAGWQLEHE
jgi:AcrR family transcriptional regulator